MTPQEIARRPLAYNNIDGVGELGLGLLFAGTAAIGLFVARGSMIYFAILIAIIHFGSKAIKERITNPRTGFVEYRNSRLSAISGAVVSALLAAAIVVVHRLHWKITAPAALYGLILAAGYAWRLALTVRWKWAIAALMAVGSLTIAFLPADLITSVAGRSLLGPLLFVFLLCGTLLLSSGGITFWFYLRHTHPPAQEAA